MEQRVLYKLENGGVGIVIPASGTGLSITEVALASVPAGVPFKIVDVAEVSSDRTFRDAWEVDELEMTDGVGA